MAFSAQRHVHIFSTYHSLAVLAGCPECEACVLFAELADGSQLLYFFALGDDFEDCREGTS